MKAFLSGTDRSLLDDVKVEMESASATLQFERAANARDKLADFTWLDERLAQLQKARDQDTMLYPLPAYDGRTTWYVIDRGQVRMACIGNADQPPAELLEPPPVALAVSDRTVDSVLLVAAWFRRHATERAKMLLVPSRKKRLALSA